MQEEDCLRSGLLQRDGNEGGQQAKAACNALSERRSERTPRSTYRRCREAHRRRARRAPEAAQPQGMAETAARTSPRGQEKSAPRSCNSWRSGQPQRALVDRAGGFAARTLDGGPCGGDEKREPQPRSEARRGGRRHHRGRHCFVLADWPCTPVCIRLIRPKWRPLAGPCALTGPKICSLQFFASVRSACTLSSACRILTTPASGGQRGGARRYAHASVLEVTQSRSGPWDGERAAIATVTRGAALRFRRQPGRRGGPGRPAHERSGSNLPPKCVGMRHFLGLSLWAMGPIAPAGPLKSSRWAKNRSVTPNARTRARSHRSVVRAPIERSSVRCPPVVRAAHEVGGLTSPVAKVDRPHRDRQRGDSSGRLPHSPALTPAARRRACSTSPGGRSNQARRACHH